MQVNPIKLYWLYDIFKSNIGYQNIPISFGKQCSRGFTLEFFANFHLRETAKTLVREVSLNPQNRPQVLPIFLAAFASAFVLRTLENEKINATQIYNIGALCPFIFSHFYGIFIAQKSRRILPNRKYLVHV